jgi:predicted secreted Zn-dependent protease
MPTSLLLALWLQAASRAAVEPIHIEDQVRTYRIEGATSEDLWNQIRAAGPIDEADHRHYASNTRTTISWHYAFVSEAHACRVDRSDVAISTVVTLPEWVDQVRGSRMLQAAWSNFITRLKLHESGHRDNAMQAALTIRHVIDTAGTDPDCAALSRAIDASAYAVLARQNRSDVDYDASTRHGEAQGATLP